MVNFKLYNNKLIKDYINNLDKCGIYHTENIKENIFNKLSEKKFLSPQEMKELYCNFNMIIKYSKINNKIPYQLSNNITKWINNISKLSVDSRQGFIYLSDILNSNQQVIIKTSKNKSYDNDLLMEYFIAEYALNNLRSIVPNFVYVYGIFQCPKISSGIGMTQIKIDKFCRKGKNLKNFVIYEKIDGKTLEKYIDSDSITPKSFLKIIIQITIALEIAQQKYGFCHFDLHYDNIMIRPANNHQYDVNMGDKTYSIRNQEFIATIIDYGFSCVNYKQNNKHRFIGKYGLEKYGIMPFMIPIFDIYKLLIFSLLKISFKHQESDILKTIKKLFDFFEDPYHIFVNNKLVRHNLYEAVENFGLKITFSKFASTTPKMFLDWILDTFKDEVSDFIRVDDRNTFKIITNDQIFDNHNYLNSNNCYYNSNSYIINKYNKEITNESNTKINRKLEYSLSKKNITVDTAFLNIMKKLLVGDISVINKSLSTFDIQEYEVKNKNRKKLSNFFHKFIHSVKTSNMNKLNRDMDLIYIYREIENKYPEKIKDYYRQLFSGFDHNTNIINYHKYINIINKILRWKEVYIYYLFTYYFENITKKNITNSYKNREILEQFNENGVDTEYLQTHKTPEI